MRRFTGLTVCLFIALPLLGIDRGSAARDSCAPISTPILRVMTYNIHVGIGMDKKLDLQRIAAGCLRPNKLLEVVKNVKACLIVVGDFNDVPQGQPCQLMRSQFGDAWAESRATTDGLSYPADKPAKRIDYIFYRSSDRVRARHA